MPTPAITRKLKTLPTKPGVYLHQDAAGKILYVGKAKNLRNRVRSYFQAGKPHDTKTAIMVSKVVDFDIIVTSSEVEALLVESNFIKQYRPPYNVVLRDDKQYQFIKVTTGETWPRVMTVRDTVDTEARHFGPYTSSGKMRTSLKILRRAFPWCDTANKVKDPNTNHRPCFSYRVGLCPGACIGKVTNGEYRKNIDGLIQFLEGDTVRLTRQLNAEMKTASANQDYERAAQLRDQLDALASLQQGQQAVNIRGANQDVVGLARDEGQAVVILLLVRNGKVVARKEFTFWGTGDSSDEEVLNSFLGQYYKVATDIPKEILLPQAVENAALITSFLSYKEKRKVTATAPQRGSKRRLLGLAQRNAAEYLRQLQEAWQANQDKLTQALSELQKELGLAQLPHRIECYDISNLTGTSTVGSMVVFEEGQPAKAHYRRFRIKHVKGIDDFSSMQEILGRRFRRMATSSGRGQSRATTSSGDESFEALPDLVIIDGGKGQVSAAALVLEQLKLGSIPLVGLAKRLEEVITFDRATKQFTSRLLPVDSQGLYLLQRIRDEAHRFAITYNRALRTKRGIRSALDDIPGIGPTKKKQLMKAFGSVRGIREAELEAIQEVVGKAAGRVVKENL